MLIMAGSKRKCRAQTLIVPPHFYLVLKRLESEIFKNQAMTLLQVLVDPKPNQLKQDTPGENEQWDTNDNDL